MKKITRKILAGILAFVMVFGCFGGMGTLEVKAAGTEVQRVLKIQLVDENGNSVQEQLALCLTLDDEIVELGSTDETGKLSFEYANLMVMLDAGYFTLGLMTNTADTDYICENRIIGFEEDFDGWYISELDDEEYNEPQEELNINLVVKKNGTNPNQILKINTMDESGNAVSNVALSLSKDGQEAVVLPKASNGLIEYPLAEVKAAGEYTLGVASTEKRYACDPIPVILEESSGNMIVSSVNSEAYTGESPVPFTVKLIKITEISAKPSIVSKSWSGDIELNVKGTNLPDTLYYRRLIRTEKGDSPISGETVTPVTPTGTATEKIFNVPLPTATNDQIGWKIEVQLFSSDLLGMESAIVSVIEGATKEELQAAVSTAEEDIAKRQEEDYVPERWAEYKEAIKAAKLLLNSEGSATDYKQAIESIKTAETNLNNGWIPSKEKVTTFEITVLDEANNPISTDSNLKFQLVKNDDQTIIYDAKMNENGVVIVDASQIDKDGYYTFKITDDSSYTTSQSITIRFSVGDVSKKIYIQNVAVAGGAYMFDPNSPRLTLNVREAQAQPKISDVSAAAALVRDEGKIDVKITGINLPDSLYYSLSYVKTAGAGTATSYDQGKKTNISAIGSDTERTITVQLPKKPADAYAWKIGVAALETQGTFDSGEIRVVAEATKAELQAAMNAANEEKPEDYTEQSWEAYKSVLQENEKVLDKQGATDLEYGAALEDIQKAKDLLVPVEATKNRTLKIKAIDEDGNPVPNLLFVMETGAGFNPISLPATGTDGTSAYTMNGLAEKNGTYKLMLKGSNDYICDLPVNVDFSVSSSQYYIQQIIVGGDKIKPGQEAVITVKKKGKITQVVSSVNRVNKDGEKATITVTGTNLQEKLFYDLYYTNKDNEQINTVSKASVMTKGVSDTERTFEVEIPAASEYPTAAEWTVSVYPTDDAPGTSVKMEVPVTGATIANLQREIRTADTSYLEEHHTRASWKVFWDAKEKAKMVAADNSATESDYQEALTALTNAIDALVKVAKAETKEELNAVINEFSQMVKANYTPESWKVYEDAVKSAKAVAEDKRASEEECLNALRAVKDAKAGLTVKTNKPSVQKVTKITISGISKKVAAGKKIQLTASVAPSDASNKAITWTSSNKKYAAVNSKGKVTVKKAGAGKSVTITATAADGSGVKATYKIQIKKHAVKSIKLKANKTVKAGRSLKVKATVKTTGKKANKTLKWTSSNAKYATVSAKGVVKAKKAGKNHKVRITASATDGSGRKKTVTIKIK
ncbi:MAG: Ig domain-containing protein [Dorea sp.]|nr:Ig domain-containing protein [Dorea sp.]